MRISREFIEKGKSDAGGWNRAQLEAIGLSWDIIKRRGWIGRVIGREIDDAAAKRFIDLRGRKV